jgi:hypothetical protein
MSVVSDFLGRLSRFVSAGLVKEQREADEKHTGRNSRAAAIPLGKNLGPESIVLASGSERVRGDSGPIAP